MHAETPGFHLPLFATPDTIHFDTIIKQGTQNVSRKKYFSSIKPSFEWAFCSNKPPSVNSIPNSIIFYWKSNSLMKKKVSMFLTKNSQFNFWVQKMFARYYCSN